MEIREYEGPFGDIRRLREMLTVFLEEGLGFFIDAASLRYLVPLRSRLKCRLGLSKAACQPQLGLKREEIPVPVRFRRAFERLGPTFMKLGQLLSVRPDIIPAEYIREFAKLQDEADALSPGTARRIVMKELGKPIEAVFKSFNDQPLAAASLAVVHEAVLRNGRKVAVKIMRPAATSTIKTDIRIMAHVAAQLETRIPTTRRFHPIRFVKEFADWTMRELDFEAESASMDRFRGFFADDETIVIPKVYWEHTTKSVIVSELITGVRIDDIRGLKRLGIDRRELAKIGLRAGLRQFLAEGVFHADPHPGNLTAMPPAKKEEGAPPRLGIYDFGMIGTISERSRFELLSCFACFLNKDIEGYVGHVIDLAIRDKDADLDAFAKETKNILTNVIYKPVVKKTVALALNDVLLAGAKHGVWFPTELILLGKAFVEIEQVGLTLWPEIDPEKELEPFVTGALVKELGPRKIAEAAHSRAFDSLYFLKHLPEQTRALFDRLERGEIGVKIDLDELRDLKREFDRQNDIRVLAIMAAVVLLVSALALRLDQRFQSIGNMLGELGLVAAAGLGFWLVVLIRRKP